MANEAASVLWRCLASAVNPAASNGKAGISQRKWTIKGIMLTGPTGNGFHFALASDSHEPEGNNALQCPQVFLMPMLDEPELIRNSWAKDRIQHRCVPARKADICDAKHERRRHGPNFSGLEISEGIYRADIATNTTDSQAVQGRTMPRPSAKPSF
jgi:hypothetical protein